jgi:phenylacetate-CoA ligase
VIEMSVGGQVRFVAECYLKRLYRHGLQHRRERRVLEQTARLAGGELTAWQDQALQRTVEHCVANVPYYRDLFRSLRLTPADIRTRADLRKLPLMDARTVRENFDALISRQHLNWLCQAGTSSGTTGAPGRFLRDFHAINFEHAALWRNWRAGGDDGKRRISLRGEIIVPSQQSSPPFWRYNPADRELQMSSYHLSPSTAVHYIEKILDFKPQILYAGPSMAHLLAKLFQARGVRYRFDAVFTSSETVAPEVRRFIEHSFETRVFDWYGQSERVAAIGQCVEGSYHVQEDYSIVEFEPAHGGMLEIVGTQLQNRVMPLLRYRTADYVVPWTGPALCACGSHFRRVDHVVGRYYGYLVTPEGYHIAITAHIPTGVENMIEAQFHQERRGEVVVKVVSNGRFGPADAEKLVANVRRHTSPMMQVKVEEVPFIPRGPNGKFVNIVNRMTTDAPLIAEPQAA